MERAVICIVNDADQAERVVDQLRDAGFASEHISVLFPDKPPTAAPIAAPESAARLGGGLGWLVGIGSLAIPGLGP